jgi:hypothetical protein
MMPTPNNLQQTPKKLSLPEVEDLMEEDAAAPAAEGGQVNVHVIGSPPEHFISVEDVLQWEGLLNSLTSFGGRVDPLDVVVVNYTLARKNDALPLSRATFSMLKGGLEVKTQGFTGGLGAMFYYRSKSGSKKGGTLTAGKELAQRSVDKQSFLWSLPIAAACPPPLFVGPRRGPHTFGTSSWLRGIVRRVS